MKRDFACPVCDGECWKEIGSRVFHRESTCDRDPYLETRFRVLFEIWHTQSSSFSLLFLQCMYCGLIVYSPRPDVDELEAKYRFLVSQKNPDDQFDAEKKFVKWKSDVLYSEISKCTTKNDSLRLLDFGGGGGELLAKFIAKGHSCDLIDYQQESRDGVRHLGNSLEDIPKDWMYHVVVISHVLEHVAEPVHLLERVRQRLEPDGLLYVEVPLECWGRVPHMNEPVTHINFFDPESLATCLQRSGYRVRRLKMGIMPTTNGWVRVVRSVAQRGMLPTRELRLFERDTLSKYLQPSLSLRLQYRLLTPRTWATSARYHFRKFLRL